MDYLRYDDGNMFSSASGEGGVRTHEVGELHDRLMAAHARLEGLRRDATQGFMDLPGATDGLRASQEAAHRVTRDFSCLLVIGIGGSDLGGRTLVQALGDREKGVPVKFLASPDPDAVAPILDDPDFLRDAAISVVSKSGSTLETAAVFFAVRDALIRAVGEKNHARHVFVTTDPTDGPLHRLAKERGYGILPHPLNVGGRFSLFSPVGLFPALCAGADGNGVLEGARWLEDHRREKGPDSMPARFAALQYLAMTARSQPIHVLMPYAARLQAFASWYRQLWAESLGKRKGNRGVGPTPVAAQGPVDQHSQVQLYAEGPRDKTVTFIETGRFRRDVRVPADLPDPFGYLSGKPFDELLRAERGGTAESLAHAGRPNGTLHIPSIEAGPVGALAQFFMTATAYMGELMGVDAYDQPGVEAGKMAARHIIEGIL
ncbi:glucose-6-phosphate isomerase [Patescibacteria group bacterium]|nr:MAG: glucose-6-phosphate isomerase [Patescibacteria group bacterium]